MEQDFFQLGNNRGDHSPFRNQLISIPTPDIKKLIINHVKLIQHISSSPPLPPKKKTKEREREHISKSNYELIEAMISAKGGDTPSLPSTHHTLVEKEPLPRYQVVKLDNVSRNPIQGCTYPSLLCYQA